MEKKYIETLLHMHFVERSLSEVKEAWKRYKEAKDAVGKRNKEIAWRNLRILMDDWKKIKRRATTRGKKVNNEVLKELYDYLKSVKTGKIKGVREDAWLLAQELGLVKKGEKRPEITERGLKCIEALKKYHFRG